MENLQEEILEKNSDLILKRLKRQSIFEGVPEQFSEGFHGRSLLEMQGRFSNGTVVRISVGIYRLISEISRWKLSESHSGGISVGIKIPRGFL